MFMAPSFAQTCPLQFTCHWQWCWVIMNSTGCSLRRPMVHIDDVARAHIFLLENPEAKGRYICSSDMITIEEMSKFLSAKYPEYPIQTLESLKGVEGFRIPGVSSKKLVDSGFKFRYGLDEMFDGAIQCCKEKGFL
ncbi:hypothetical protein OIU78_003238 [Salix suchowensis]|nr:hypothetical protein OIU78_003238 [Salix suchowensis]